MKRKAKIEFRHGHNYSGPRGPGIFTGEIGLGVVFEKQATNRERDIVAQNIVCLH